MRRGHTSAYIKWNKLNLTEFKSVNICYQIIIQYLSRLKLDINTFQSQNGISLRDERSLATPHRFAAFKLEVFDRTI